MDPELLVVTESELNMAGAIPVSIQAVPNAFFKADSKVVSEPAKGEETTASTSVEPPATENEEGTPSVEVGKDDMEATKESMETKQASATASEQKNSETVEITSSPPPTTAAVETKTDSVVREGGASSPLKEGGTEKDKFERLSPTAAAPDATDPGASADSDSPKDPSSSPETTPPPPAATVQVVSLPAAEQPRTRVVEPAKVAAAGATSALYNTPLAVKPAVGITPSPSTLSSSSHHHHPPPPPPPPSTPSQANPVPVIAHVPLLLKAGGAKGAPYVSLYKEKERIASMPAEKLKVGHAELLQPASGLQHNTIELKPREEMTAARPQRPQVGGLRGLYTCIYTVHVHFTCTVFPRIGALRSC